MEQSTTENGVLVDHRAAAELLAAKGEGQDIWDQYWLQCAARAADGRREAQDRADVLEVENAQLKRKNKQLDNAIDELMRRLAESRSRVVEILNRDGGRD